jgi:lipopolysaccharide transport system permease protein
MESSKIKIRIETFVKYSELMKQLVMRDLKLKYRRSFLGYLWSILNPLLIMLVMVIVFSNLFDRNGSIPNYAVYLISGRTIFEFISGSTTDAMRSIIGNASLIKKVYVPKYVFTLAKITSAVVNMVFSMGALLLVMLFTRAPFTWHFILFPVVVLQVYIFSCGLGFFLAQANVFFRDIQYIYKAFTTAWMYATPLFYSVDQMHGSVKFVIQYLNPAYYYVEQFRCFVYRGSLPELHVFLGGWLIAIVAFLIGLFTFKRAQDRFILYI